MCSAGLSALVTGRASQLLPVKQPAPEDQCQVHTERIHIQGGRCRRTIEFEASDAAPTMSAPCLLALLQIDD